MEHAIEPGCCWVVGLIEARRRGVRLRGWSFCSRAADADEAERHMLESGKGSMTVRVLLDHDPRDDADAGSWAWRACLRALLLDLACAIAS